LKGLQQSNASIEAPINPSGNHPAGMVLAANLEYQIKMSYRELFSEHEARERSAVMHDTWGHLAPTARVRHKGFIVFAKTCYRQEVVIESEFSGLNDSPWYYDALHDYISEKLNTRDEGIYRFDGDVYMCLNGKFKFSGKTNKIHLIGSAGECHANNRQ